jgi:NOL1/NOP2/fmu family ribosome biogenesis protein
MNILKSSEKKQIEKELKENFGIEKIPYLLLKSDIPNDTEEKIRAYSGSLSKEELKILGKNLNIEAIGIYFAKIQKDGIRLTVDGVILLKDQIKKNIIELDNEQSEKWLRGEDLEIKSDINFKILKNKGDFLGCGKSTGEKIVNTVPRERRRR